MLEGTVLSQSMRIPGISNLMENEKIPDDVIFLLTAPSGSGKTMYCRQFFTERLLKGDYCIYISSNLTDKHFASLFSNIEKLKLAENSKFINPLLDNAQSGKETSTVSFSLHSSNKDVTSTNNKLSYTIDQIKNTMDQVKHSKTNNGSILLVIDSLTHLVLLFGESAVLRFVAELVFILKDAGVTAIFASTSTATSEYFTSTLSSIVDGVIEMNITDSKMSLVRSIRLLSFKGLRHNPSWINFKISDDGSLVFEDQSFVFMNCMLCGKEVKGEPIVESDLIFDSQNCVETYRKLAGVFNLRISEIGLPSVVNTDFFYIDIVGLSNPSLSTQKQIEKIEILNKLIGSCDAFSKTPTEKRIVLPTGDGMAIGFFSNPELPLQLSIQLHHKLRNYNRNKKSDEDMIGVRIGLSSGPVFIVNDINNSQNVWGPGIILARRVMDVGDNLHILLADRLAEELITLKDDYRVTIKYLCDYQIKHGQTIKLFNAYCEEFGNSNLPARIVDHVSKNNSTLSI